MPGARLSAMRARCRFLARVRHLHQVGIDDRLVHQARDRRGVVGTGAPDRDLLPAHGAAASAHDLVVQEDLVALDLAREQAQAAHVVAIEAGAVGERRRVAADDDRAQRHVHLVDRIGGEELEQQVAARFDQEMVDAARGEALEDPADRRVAVARPGLDLAGKAGLDGGGARHEQRPDRRLGQERRRQRHVERAADDDVPRPRLQQRPVGRVGKRGVRPVAKCRAADQHRVGLGAQPAHSRVVAGAAEEREAAFPRVDPAVERHRRVADDLHRRRLSPRRAATSLRPRVICTPAHSRPCTGGRFLTLTVT